MVYESESVALLCDTSTYRTLYQSGGNAVHYAAKSQHAISMLEQELETNLFEKRGRNVVLTKYGKVFLEYVEEALKILDSGVKKTRALTSDTGGVIDLAYIFTLGSVFVPQLVDGFLKEHEDWDVNFRFLSEIRQRLYRG